MRKLNKLPKRFQNDTCKRYYDIVNNKFFSYYIKLVFDRAMALFLLILLSPILLIFSIWIKLDSPGGIFYRQERITQYGRKFKIFKFRTMVSNADKKGSLITLENDVRITRVGKLIRKYRLDEIPQLINVLIGDMSFVGARPEVEKYVDCYSDEMVATLLLPAGITSMSSINFKDEDRIISKYLEKNETVDEIYVHRILPDKMKYNVDYIKNFNFLVDIKIMIKTVLKLF